MTKAEIRELKVIALSVARRVFSVYNRTYIQKCLKNEPNSLLALVAKLKKAAAKS